MRILVFGIAVGTLLGACSGQVGKQPDGGVACTMTLYDPCREEHDCASANCKPFAAAGITVCTQTCTPGDNSTCPQQAGMEVECTAMAICKPPIANDCHIPGS